MTPQYEWEDDLFPRGVDVFVGAHKRPGVVHSRSLTGNGVYVYGVRWKDPDYPSLGRREPDSVDCYCEVGDMESMLF